MHTKIRRAEARDVQILAHLNEGVQDLHLRHRPKDFKQVEPAALAEWFRSMVENPITHIWIADADEEPVGYLLAMFQHAAENVFVPTRDWCEIVQLAVLPSYRRRGMARLLISTAIDAAKARGIHQIEATSWSFNKETHEVFRRLGFTAKIIRFELG